MKDQLSDDQSPPPMNWRSLITMFAVTTAIMGIVMLQRHFQETLPPAPVPANPSATANAGSTAAAPQPATSGPVLNVGWTLAPAATTAPTPSPVSLGSAQKKDPTWAVQLNLEPAGAGIQGIILNQFDAPTEYGKPSQIYSFQSEDKDVPGTKPFASRWVEVDGTRLDISSTIWTLEPSKAPSVQADTMSASYSTVLYNHNVPGLKLTKTFTIFRREPPPDAVDPGAGEQKSQGYEIRIDYTMTNLTAASVSVKSDFNGPTLPPKEGGRGADRQALAGYQKKSDVDVAFHPIAEFRKDKQPNLDLAKNDKGTMNWFGSCSNYFEALILPLNGSAAGDFIEHAQAQAWKLDDTELQSEDRPLTIDFNTTLNVVKAGDTLDLPMDLYAGPKWRDVVADKHYSSLPRAYESTLVMRGGSCGIPCTFDWLIQFMVLLLTFFHALSGGFVQHGRYGDWGIAIILLVGVVRLALHPITKKSQVQMMKMGKMGPELERLKKKYGDDKDELNRQMVEFYKTQGATPILGCLPMFLQMPIWIALYSALQSTFELRQSPFLWNLTWIHDLAQPDGLFHFSAFHPLLFVPFFGLNTWTITGINLLPIGMGVVFFLQQKYMTPPNPAMTEEQRKQQKMMQWLTPFIFPLMLYNGPSGLNIYIFASTLFGVVESKIIRRHIKEREEAEKAGRVIVDARPTRLGKKSGPTAGSNEPPSGLFGGVQRWWANFEKRIQTAQREAEKRNRKDR